jgi:hypothetical protein
MERWLNGAAVVFFWFGTNVLMAALLAGLTASGTDGGAGPAGALEFILYGISLGLILLTGILVGLSKRYRHGLREPARPAAALMLAVSIALLWLGVAWGFWISVTAFVPFLVAVMMEISAHRRPSEES